MLTLIFHEFLIFIFKGILLHCLANHGVQSSREIISLDFSHPELLLACYDTVSRKKNKKRAGVEDWDLAGILGLMKSKHWKTISRIRNRNVISQGLKMLDGLAKFLIIL